MSSCKRNYYTAELQTCINHPRANDQATTYFSATRLPRQAGWQLLFECFAHGTFPDVLQRCFMRRTTNLVVDILHAT